MKKNLLTKIQKITPNHAQKTSAFSNVIIINAENEALLERKGNIYCVFSISSAVEIDTLVTTKIIQDYLHDNYYQAESVSPTQTIEKCISEIKDRVVKITNDPATELNMVCGVLWGNIFYYVLYGTGSGYLVRDGLDKTINPNSEGRFSSASGLVKDQDVIVLATEKFAEEYTPGKLLNTSISIQNLTPLSACLIIKAVVESGFSEQERLDIKTPTSQKQNKPQKPKKPLSFFGFLAKSKILTLILPVILALGILGVGIYFFLNKTGTPKDSQNTASKNSQVAAVKGTTDPTPTPTPTAVPNPSEKTTKNEFPVFYDLAITDQSITPTEIVYLDDTIYVADKTTGKIFSSDSETPKFTALTTAYTGIRNLRIRKSSLTFLDKNGFNVASPTDGTSTFSYKNDFEASANYLDFVYANVGSSLYRYSIVGETMEQTLWGESSLFNNMRSMTIAINIYTIDQSGEIHRFSKGAVEDFTLKGLSKKLVNPIKIITHIDYSHLYILDAGGNKISIFDKEGNFVSHVMHSNAGAWTNLKDMAINSDETQMAVLDGTKAYLIKL